MICEWQRARYGGVEVTDGPNDQGSGQRPMRILLVYYTYTGQSQKVLKAAAEVFRERGCEVHEARIEFTDARFAERFTRFPMRHVWRDMFSVLPAQRHRLCGEIRTPDEVRTGDYDFVCIGSPTWWQDASMPIRSFLTSGEAKTTLSGKPFAVFVVCRRYWRENMDAVRELGTSQGGRFLGGIHFTYPGGQLPSMLSLTSYLGSGEYRRRYLGIRIPTTNVQPQQLVEARVFASELIDQLSGEAMAKSRGTH
jgi:menaquinone-dependent protoporphyrinogen IX oxidase